MNFKELWNNYKGAIIGIIVMMLVSTSIIILSLNKEEVWEALYDENRRKKDVCEKCLKVIYMHLFLC